MAYEWTDKAGAPTGAPSSRPGPERRTPLGLRDRRSTERRMGAAAVHYTEQAVLSAAVAWRLNPDENTDQLWDAVASYLGALGVPLADEAVQP